MDGYHFADLALRALAFVVVLYLLWGAVRIARWLWRAVTSMRVTDLAQAAGSASARLEQKAQAMTEAFKQGRNQR